MNRIANVVILITILLLTNTGMLADSECFNLSLNNLKNGQTAPLSYINSTIGGKNFSPAISWSGIPVDTESLILTCIDKNPVANNWVHWMILNIPTNIKSLPENVSQYFLTKIGCIICKNSFGTNNYEGPQPPKDTGIHNYVFTLYALKSKIYNIEKFSFISEANLLNKIDSLIISKTTFTLTCQQ